MCKSQFCRGKRCTWQCGEEKLEFCLIFIHLQLQKWQGGGGGREALGLVPGLLIDGCRMQAGRAGNAEPRDAANSIPVRNHSQIP